MKFSVEGQKDESEPCIEWKLKVDGVGDLAIMARVIGGSGQWTRVADIDSLDCSMRKYIVADPEIAEATGIGQYGTIRVH